MSNLTRIIVFVIGLGLVSYASSCRKDKCKDVNCMNGGTCDEGICSCAAGFEGEKCESAFRDKFLNPLGLVDEVCDGLNSPPDTIEITAGSSSNTIVIANLGNYFCTVGDYVVLANVVTTDSIHIANQEVCNGLFMEGSGTYSNGQLIIDYYVTFDDGSGPVTNHCTATIN